MSNWRDKYAKARAQLEDQLEKDGVKFAIQYAGEGKDGSKDPQNRWEYDAWNYAFERAGHWMTGPYKTGIGHRKWAKRSLVKVPAVLAPEQALENAPPTSEIGAPRTVLRKQMEDSRLRPVYPHVSDVLYCLLSDARGSDQIFDDWCADYGYDTDSRKALEMYLEGQKTGKELRKILPDRQVYEKLLEDW